MAKIPNSPAMGLYLHIPFCTQRCIYCDFYFVTSTRNRSPFVDALCKEISRTPSHYRQTPVATIYFGGGTPSRLPYSDVARIMQVLDDTFDTRAVKEVTFELNPEDVSKHYLADLQACGITRPSIGIQSFCDDDLKFLNRAHDVAAADQALDVLKQAGFASWTMDLIFALPNQSLQQWSSNLGRATEVNPPHISTYNLTVEPRTPLYKQVERGHVQPVSQDEAAEAFQLAIDSLESAGYAHYEISSFARAGHTAQHNQAYWRHRNYLGYGPSAHSFWWDAKGARRWRNVSNLKTYLSRVGDHRKPDEYLESLTPRELATECIMLGLRTDEGVSLQRLKSVYNVELPGAQLRALQDAGLIKCESDRVRLTLRGKHVCDAVTSKLLPD